VVVMVVVVLVMVVMAVVLLLLLLLLLSATVLTLPEAPCTQAAVSQLLPLILGDVSMLRIEQGVLMVLHLQVVGRQSK